MPYLTTAVILLAIEMVYFQVASKFDITDDPNHRSSHTKPTIRGGGIIFPMAVLCYALGKHPVSWYWIAGLFMISLISFLDDILTLPNKARISVHLAAVSLLLYDLHIFILWPLALIILVYILVIGTINAWNFMDGINGITILYCASALVTLWYLNRQYAFADNNLIFIIAIAALIFGFFNCRKNAVCFAGDVGAVSIAFIMIFLMLSLIIVASNPVFVLLFAVYGVDSVMTICYRLSHRENIFKAHRSHLYQLMANECQIPHLLVSGIYFMIQILVNILLVSILAYPASMQWIIGAGVLMVLTCVYWITRFKLMQGVVNGQMTSSYQTAERTK